MTIDDKYIKSVVKTYQAMRSTKSLDEIIEHLSSYIYHYPRKVFGMEHEIATDFYLYYIERIDLILLKYVESEVKFITWFTVTLRNTYLNFAKKIKAQKYNFKTVLSLDAKMGNEKLTLYDVIPSASSESGENINDIAKNIFNTIKSRFDIRDSLIFSIHNLELFIFAIIEPIKIFFSISIDEVYKIFEKARASYIKKYNSMIKQQDLISSLNYRIKKYENIGRDTTSLKNRKEKYQKSIAALRLTVPYSYIAKLFSTTDNAVNKVILKIKKYLAINNLF